MTTLAAPRHGPPALESLRRKGQEAVQEGRYEEALLIYEHALELARETGESDDTLDLFLVNHAAVRIELAEDDRPVLDEELATLRSVLGRSANLENGWLASYQIARLYERRRDFKKAHFYARMAHDRAAWTDVAFWRATSSNLLGNVLLADSHVVEAVAAYRDALSALGDADEVSRWRISANVGYCLLLQQRTRQGMAMIYDGLRRLRRRRLERFSISPHLDLAFGHLELQRPLDAQRHASRALELAATYRDTDARKNSLFLLGEAQHRLDRHDLAAQTFSTLQRDFYAGNPSLVRQLLAIDVVPLLNLRA
jgi:tetratricopeptide (TPR) repeat protein